MPASKSVCLLKLSPSWAEIEYFIAKTRKFINLPALAQNPGYVTSYYAFQYKHWMLQLAVSVTITLDMLSIVTPRGNPSEGWPGEKVRYKPSEGGSGAL